MPCPSEAGGRQRVGVRAQQAASTRWMSAGPRLLKLLNQKEKLKGNSKGTMGSSLTPFSSQSCDLMKKRKQCQFIPSKFIFHW